MRTVDKLPYSLKALRENERGSIMAWTALGVASLLGVAALTVDMGYMYVLNNQLQTTADAAASAAVKELPDAGAALTAAQNIVEQNMPSAAHGNVATAADVQVGNWDSATRTFTQGGSPSNAVRVNARRDNTNNNAARTFFASVMGFEEVSIGASATATQGTAAVAPACVVALEPSSDAITMTNNSVVNLDGCGLSMQSTSASALSGTNNATITVANAQVCLDEDVSTPGYDTLNFATINPTPQECGQIVDPMGSIPAPTQDAHGHLISGSTCDATNSTPASGGLPLLPGIYCGGLVIGPTVTKTLSPGIYIMKPSTGGSARAGNLVVNGSLTGNNVFIYLTGSFAGAASTVQMGGNSTLDLRPPTTGAYAGIVIFQDRNLLAGAGNVSQFYANTNTRFGGAVYMPNTRIVVTGNAAAGSSLSHNASCTVFVARQYVFGSNAAFTGAYDPTSSCAGTWAANLGGGGTSVGFTTLVK